MISAISPDSILADPLCCPPRLGAAEQGMQAGSWHLCTFRHVCAVPDL
jgi:hypothetical protein